MGELITALERIFAWWQTHKPDEVDRFNPGLSLEEIQEKLGSFPGQLPQEIHTLYQWHNGIADDSWSYGIFVYHSFLEIDIALQQAEEYINAKSVMNYRREENLPLYLFPFCEFEGEYFAVPVVDHKVDSAPVFFIDEIGEMQLAFTSLTNMMLALAECYESGVYAVRNDGLIQVVDEAKFGEIRRKHNPGTAEKLFADGW